MSWSWVTAGTWICHTAAGGGVLLLLVWGLMRLVRQPARQQRLGECGLLAALLLAVLSLGPSWLVISVPVRGLAAAPAVDSVAAPEALPPEDMGQAANLPDTDGGPATSPLDADSGLNELTPRPPLANADAGEQAEAARSPLPPPQQRPTGDDEIPPPATSPPPRSAWLSPLLSTALAWLGAAYVLLAVLLAGRWLLGHLALWRLLRTAEPAPEPVERLFAALAAGGRRPRLLVSRRLRVPVSCGLSRPTVVLPATLCADPAALRWVFRHELTHLERRDPWTCLLFCLGQIVYFYLPWFWWVRRQVGLCQEFIADAAVAGAEEAPEDYADFLLGLTRAPAVPAGAAGLAGRPSDLFRRITMLLRAPLPVEKCCPLRWSAAAALGLTTTAVLGSGVGFEAVAAPGPPEVAAALAAPVAAAPPPARTESVPPGEARAPAPRPEAAAPGPDAGEPVPPAPPPVPALPDAPRPGPQETNPEPRPGPARARRAEDGRLGIRVAVPDPTLIDQLDLPAGQGLVVAEILADSPAARAGLRAHDVLLALDGRAVPADRWQFARLVEATRADVSLTAQVVRRCRRQTITGLVLPRVPPAREQSPRPFGLPGRPPFFAPGVVVLPSADQDPLTRGQGRPGRSFSPDRPW